MAEEEVKRGVSYPLEPATRLPRPSLVQRVSLAIKSRSHGAGRLDASGITLTALRFRPLAPDDLPLIVVVHNDIGHAEALLGHYRRLGVTRFLIVDDQSSDGTKEFLAAQPDVDLYVSDVRFAEARRGRIWREMLVQRYGRDRWYVGVDSDEFLVYEDFEHVGIPTLIEALERAGIEHLAAPMLDLYPPGRVAEAPRRLGATMPWTVASLLDGSGYRIGVGELGWSLRGGVRARVFSTDLELMKYPLMRWGRRTDLARSLHNPAPYDRNFGPVLGVLLHFKFLGDYREAFKRIVAEGQHFRGGIFYREMLGRIEDASDLVLEHPVSIPFAGSRDLVTRGFMASWQ